MAQFTKETTLPERSTVGACTSGMMDPAMKVNGRKTRSRVWEYTPGSMGVSIRASGLTTTCTEAGFTHGKTAASTKESIKMIRNTATASTPGLMAADMPGIGVKENSMVWVLTKCRNNHRNLACGKRASG